MSSYFKKAFAAVCVLSISICVLAQTYVPITQDLFRRICNPAAMRRGFAIPSKKAVLMAMDCKSLYSMRPDYKSARTGEYKEFSS